MCCSLSLICALLQRGENKSNLSALFFTFIPLWFCCFHRCSNGVSLYFLSLLSLLWVTGAKRFCIEIGSALNKQGCLISSTALCWELMSCFRGLLLEVRHCWFSCFSQIQQPDVRPYIAAVLAVWLWFVSLNWGVRSILHSPDFPLINVCIGKKPLPDLILASSEILQWLISYE